MSENLLPQIKSNIDFVRKNVKKSEIKWIELDKLERSAEKVFEFSNECYKCELELQELLFQYSNELKQNVDNIEYGTKRFKNMYNEKFRPAIIHLIDHHNCHIKNSYLLGRSVIGLVLDMTFFIISYFGFLPLWKIPFFTIIGTSMGLYFDYKVKKDGRALYK